MSANFVRASSQFLENTGIGALGTTVTYPFTAAFWFQPTDTSAGRVWSYAESASASNIIGFGVNSSVGVVMQFPSGTTTAIGTGTVNGWHFGIFRAIASNNFRGACLFPTGAIAHAQRTVNLTIAPNRMALGCNDLSTRATFFQGNIAEYWLSGTDVQADNGAINEDFLRALAYDGPFTVPLVKARMIDYRSLRQSLSSDAERGSEIYVGRMGRQIWTNNNGVIIGPHVPVHHNATFKSKAAAAWSAITGGAGSAPPSNGAVLLVGA